MVHFQICLKIGIAFAALAKITIKVTGIGKP